MDAEIKSTTSKIYQKPHKNLKRSWGKSRQCISTQLESL